MPRSFMVKNRRRTTFNVYRPLNEELEVALCAGETDNLHSANVTGNQGCLNIFILELSI